MLSLPGKRFTFSWAAPPDFTTIPPGSIQGLRLSREWLKRLSIVVPAIRLSSEKFVGGFSGPGRRLFLDEVYKIGVKFQQIKCII